MVILNLEEKGPIDILINTNEKYLGQSLYVVELNNYIYLVPFVKNNDEIFLKTIYPSRKATDIYIRRKKND